MVNNDKQTEGMLFSKNILLSMDDEYFSDCITELEDSLEAGWELVDQEYDECSNSSLITLERKSSY